MAEKRDFLDEIIDMQADWKAVSNPLGNVANALALDPSEVKTYNPSDYKERPRPNAMSCLRTESKKAEACSRCVDVCPVAAISFDGSSINIADTCRKCGLCVAACPTEALFATGQMAQGLYDTIARVANTYEECYITCTRALGRIPKDNEVLLPCVGAVPRELWFSLLADYRNLSVYLPLGICDKCRTTTGEEAFSEAIAAAEETSHGAVGLEVDEKDLGHEQSRAFKRSQFVSNVAQAGTSLVAAGNPMLAGTKAVTERIKKHTQQINALQQSLEEVTGGKTTNARRRTLTQKRKLLLTTLQKKPELAEGLTFEVPVCDTARCTMCGDCMSACVSHACDLDNRGHFSVEPTYCLNCGACVAACGEKALTMQAIDSQRMVIPDPKAEKVAEQRKKVQEAKRKSKKAVSVGLSALETFAAALSEEEEQKKKASATTAKKTKAAKKTAKKTSSKAPSKASKKTK